MTELVRFEEAFEGALRGRTLKILENEFQAPAEKRGFAKSSTQAPMYSARNPTMHSARNPKTINMQMCNMMIG